MNSSDNAFDLLNDKISFFGGNTSMDAFLEEGPSFGDEDSFGIINHKVVKERFEAKHEPEPKVDEDLAEPPVIETSSDQSEHLGEDNYGAYLIVK